MTLNFPSSPSNGDVYTFNGVRFEFDGDKWTGGSEAVSTISLTATELSDTVQTSTSSSSNTTINHSNTVQDNGDIGDTYYLINVTNVNDGSTLDAQFDSMTAGDTFQIQWNAGTETYTYQDHQIQNDFPFNNLLLWYNGNSGTSNGQTGVDFVFTGPTLRQITGSNNPIWDDTLDVVTINGTDYNTSDWTVSGTTATHNTLNPTINTGETIAQSTNISALGGTGDTKSSMTISGKDASLVISDGTDTLTLTPTTATASSGTFTPIFEETSGTPTVNGYWYKEGKKVTVMLHGVIGSSESLLFSGMNNSTGNARNQIIIPDSLGTFVGYAAGQATAANANAFEVPNPGNTSIYGCVLGTASSQTNKNRIAMEASTISNQVFTLVVTGQVS